MYFPPDIKSGVIEYYIDASLVAWKTSLVTVSRLLHNCV